MTKKKMEAYVLIKFHSSRDYHPVGKKISGVSGVIKADKVFGPYDIVAKIKGETRKDISRITDAIAKTGELHEIITMISYPKMDHNNAP